MRRNSILIALLAGSSPALAQQTTVNVVTQSDDAFGRAVGTERIGIYSQEEVRGFNPIEAGNQRLEGLYIEQGAITPPRLQESSSVRVGYAARGLPFPAPTGIVDMRIAKFTGQERYNVQIESETYSNVGGAFEAKIPLSGERLGLAAGLGFRVADQTTGRNGAFLNWMVGASWLPHPGSELTVFTSGTTASSAEYPMAFFPSGSAPPPEQPRKLQQVQPWAESHFLISVSGGVAKFSVGNIRVEAGLFRATRRDPESYFTLLLGVSPDGRIANHVVIADGNNRQASTSGEFRLSRTWERGDLRHTLIASIRGRAQDRRFAGQQRISLGPSVAGIQDIRSKPSFVLGADDTSAVRQMIYGLQYNLQSRGGSQLSLATQQARYGKTNDFANPSLTDLASHDRPWLFSASGSLALTPRLTAYGGYVRGFEESASAPDIAVNRSEAPPALRTRQMDAGLRYALTNRLAVIAGVFDIRKPYFGLDAGLRFSNLGTVSNRGVELSVAGSLVTGLTLVAGGIIVDPRISGAEYDAGRVGRRPVGSFGSKGIFNLDWRPRGNSAWSVDLAFEAISSETADRLNTYETDGRTNLNFGARYRFSIDGTHFLLRAQVQNVFDSYGWRVNNSGGFTYTQPRTGYLQLATDF